MAGEVSVNMLCECSCVQLFSVQCWNRKIVRIPVKIEWKKSSMDRITEYESKTNVTQLGLIDSNIIAFYDFFSTANFSNYVVGHNIVNIWDFNFHIDLFGFVKDFLFSPEFDPKAKIKYNIENNKIFILNRAYLCFLAVIVVVLKFILPSLFSQQSFAQIHLNNTNRSLWLNIFFVNFRQKIFRMDCNCCSLRRQTLKQRKRGHIWQNLRTHTYNTRRRKKGLVGGRCVGKRIQ